MRQHYMENTPPSIFLQSGHVEFVKLLVWRGANIWLQRHDGKTACEVARETGHKEIVKLLS
jgi:ankyrin repeat protein